MKRGKTLIIVGAVALAFWYFTTQSKRLDIGAAAVSSVKLTGGSIRINVRIPVINRSDFSVTVSNFLGSLLYGGASIGTTQLVSQATLPGRSQSFLEFSTSVSLLSVATSTPLLGILNALAFKYLNVSLPGLPVQMPTPDQLPGLLKSLRIRGTLYLGAIGIDVNEPLTV